MSRVLLIHPPVSKPGEPPLGLARLKSHLQSIKTSCDIIDANLEGLYFLLNQPADARDKWTLEASGQVGRHVQAIREGSAFQSIDHYNRIVRDLGRVLWHHGMQTGYQLGLADIGHDVLSTARSRDLLHCAEHPEVNPYYSYYEKDLLPLIEKSNPEVIGISIQFLSQAWCAFALIGLICKRLPQSKIIVGGGLVTSWMQLSAWQNPFSGLVDACVSGPGELFFENYFHQESVQNEFATPDFSSFQIEKYLSPGFVLPYNTSTGCYWRKCRFCPECAEGNAYHPIDQKQVFQDLEYLSQNQNPSLIHFLDNALSPSFLKKLIELPLSNQTPWYGAPWYGYVRFHEDLVDPEFCHALKASGCTMLKLGLESGDQTVLDAMEKGIELKRVSTIFQNLKEAGIRTFVYLLFGTPYESKFEAQKTMDFTVAHADLIEFINPAIFNMPIESAETSHYLTRPFSDGDLSLYVDFDHPTGWDRLKVRHFLDRKFKRHERIARILRRTPRVFTSNHAAFFTNGFQ